LTRSSTFASKQAQVSDESVLTASAAPDAQDLNHQIRVLEMAQSHRVGAETSIFENEAFSEIEDLATNTALGISGTFSINGQEIVIDEDHSLLQIREDINNLIPDVGATILDGHLVISGELTGEENLLEMEDEEGTVLQDLTVIDSEGNFYETYETEARDALFEVDGMQVTRAQNTGINDVIQGVTLNLHSPTSGEDFVNLNIMHDTDTAVEEIAVFVETYNEIQAYLQELTQEEGFLQGDFTLNNMRSTIRQELMSSVSLEHTQFSHLSQLGIEVDEEGVMTLDAATLEQALAQDPGGVQAVFMGREEQDGADGVARSLQNQLQNYLRFNTGTLARTERNLDSRIERLDRRIANVERRLESREKTLRRQFSRMEVMLDSFQAQGAWLEGQLGGLLGREDRRR